jgi:hypothetical protein
LSVKLTPVGRFPDSEKVGVGIPVDVTVKDPSVPTWKVVPSPDVMAGGMRVVFTVRAKDWLASGLIPLEAPMVMSYVPVVPAAGVPPRVAVPFPLSVKVKPEGRAPDSDREAVGLAVDVTVNELEIVSAKLVVSADVMTGAASTVRVKDWEASGLIPLEA